MKYQIALNALVGDSYLANSSINLSASQKEILDEITKRMADSLQELVDRNKGVKPIPIERNSMKICAKCGHSLFILDAYCSHCGQALDWSDYA